MNEPGEINSRTIAWITGASSGFGLLSAAELAKQGCIVVATMRRVAEREERIRQFTREHATDDNIHIWELDVHDEAAVKATAARIVKEFGKIDVVVNNAGIAVGGYVEDLPMEAWRSQYETNVFGVIHVCKAVVPYMRKARTGRIIQISSISGVMGFPGLGPYCSSKFALEGFSESLRMEMAPYHVDVFLVEPGSYKTDIWERSMAQIHLPESSPNKTSVKRLLEYFKHSATHAPDPEPVVNLVARLALNRSRSKRLRYPIGKGTRTMSILKSLLPWSSFERGIWRSLGVKIPRRK